MPKNKSPIFLIIFVLGAVFAFNACDGALKSTSRLNGIKAKTEGEQLTIAMVDELIEKNTKKNGPGPDFTSDLTENMQFKETPMGAYLQNWLPGMAPAEQVTLATSKIIQGIGENPVCLKACTPTFLEEFKNNKQEIDARLNEVAQMMAVNELRNQKQYTVFYHAFPNEFRLYQDVLRALKTFEFLTKLSTTYPFRDFPFNDEVSSLDTFLQGWWAAYLAYAEEQGESPFPDFKGDRRHPAASVGLTFWPDSIPYAQKNIFSANVNFLGNNFLPMNSSIFYFMNSTSATGLDVEKNNFIKRSLTPYLLGSNGELDEDRFKKVADDLKNIFERYMMKSAGQVAQIFVKNSSVPEVAFMSWNGGEPIWLSKTTGNVIMREKRGNKVFMPTNVFWPTTPEQVAEYELFNVVDFMDLFINNSALLTQKFPVTNDPRAKNTVDIFFGQADQNTLKIDDFITQDYAQARIFPAPKVFTDEEVTGVKIFTRNPIKPEDEERYYQEIFEVVRDVISNFLANAKSAADFKEGTYKLKSAFIDAQENSETPSALMRR